MAVAIEFFNQLNKEIEGVKPGKMFGALCMKLKSGKAAAMLWQDCLVVKLENPLKVEVLALDGAKPFEPMEGRVMNGWFLVPFHYNKIWEKLVLASKTIAESAPVKVKR